jgi:hypothetical protein
MSACLLTHLHATVRLALTTAHAPSMTPMLSTARQHRCVREPAQVLLVYLMPMRQTPHNAAAVHHAHSLLLLVAAHTLSGLLHALAQPEEHTNMWLQGYTVGYLSFGLIKNNVLCNISVREYAWRVASHAFECMHNTLSHRVQTQVGLWAVQNI